MKIRFFFILSSVALVFLPACSVFAPVNNQQNQYILGQVPKVRTAEKKHIRLVVLRPATPAIYNTTQMAYSQRKWQISYFAKNRWGEKPTDMIQNLLIRTFEATHAFSAVSKVPSGGAKERILHSEIERLEEDLTGSVPVFCITLRAELQSSGGRILAARRFSARTPLTAQSPYAMVVAANKAVADVLHQTEIFFTKKMHYKGSSQ